MRTRSQRYVRLPILICSLLLMSAGSAQAQSVLSVERLDDWFKSRLAWGLLISAIAGALVGTFHISLLKFPPTLLHINGIARKRIGLWAIIVFVLGCLWLLVDAWSYPFAEYDTLDFGAAFSEVWMNWRTLLIIIPCLFSFVLLVATTTRWMPWSRCRYVLWPGPQGG